MTKTKTVTETVFPNFEFPMVVNREGQRIWLKPRWEETAWLSLEDAENLAKYLNVLCAESQK